jgi:hypothetical protein
MILCEELHCDKPDHYYVDASEIGLRPGEQPPPEIEILAKGMFDREQTVKDKAGEITGWIYSRVTQYPKNGKLIERRQELMIFND